MSATTTLDGRPAVRPVERAGATGAAVRARAARPRAATPVFVDGGRRARLLRFVGRLTAVALTAWIALTAIALVGPPWADGLRLRSDRAVAHVVPGAGDGSPADRATGGAPLFTAPGAADGATAADPPGSGLLGPLAVDDAVDRAADAAPDTTPGTHPSPDAQDRAGAARGPGPAARPR